MWDPDLMAKEVRRLAAKGCHAVTFSENPYMLGLPTLHDPVWNPFWQACSDLGTVVCVHIGSSSQMPSPHPDAPMPVTFTLVPLNLLSAAADLIWSPIMQSFPDLKFALSEGGIGWIPYFLERIDYVYQQQARWLGIDFKDQLPSDIFRQHFINCFISDDRGLEMKESIGIDSICWESDYPHSDSTWPNSPEMLATALDGMQKAEVAQITHGNAMRHFQYDPFSHLTKAEASVGALRAKAQDVDVTFIPPDHPERKSNGATSYQLVVPREVEASEG
jgi:predicted TIM-barrel fold metal-dependent hydrolase